VKDERFQSLREILENERQRLIRRIDNMNETGLNMSLTQSTRELSGYDNHPADQGSETFEREKDLALRRNAQFILGKIEDALKNMDEGSYGFCERCGGEIYYQRLLALPYTTLCLSCKEEEEKFLDPYRRPIEEEVLYPPFARSDLDDTSELLYDGEDAWQDVARYGTSSSPQDEPPSTHPSNAYTDSFEDRGLVEDVEGVLDDGEDADMD
jgi:YteA family regulatory protein